LEAENENCGKPTRNKNMFLCNLVISLFLYFVVAYDFYIASQ